MVDKGPAWMGDVAETRGPRPVIAVMIPRMFQTSDASAGSTTKSLTSCLTNMKPQA